MPKPTDLRIVDVATQTERIAYRAPIKFGGRVVTDAVLWNVRLRVETLDGRSAEGLGSMPVGNVWAWPSTQLAPPQTLQAMLALGQKLEAALREYRGAGHPLDVTRELATQHEALADEVVRELALPEPIPKLAQLVIASPFEAAIHDGYGKALAENAYNLLGPDYVSADLSHYLTPEFRGEYLDRYTLRQPKAWMPLYHLVGALDPLTEADIAQPLDDGLPQTLGEWVLRDGLTHLKIKLNGDDLAWDVQRVVGVEQVVAQAQAQRGVTVWHYSLDFNEKCQNVEYLLDFLAQLKARAPEALKRVQYIEQPTHRDLKRHPENRMHRAAAIKPVVIDESLVDLESLELARAQGYSGVALKACKGHTEALLMGAAAQKYGMFLCVQDLSCPGFSFLHSASLAARIPTVAAIEGNSRQYCPAGNVVWSQRYPTLFQPRGGQIETGLLTGPGLGF
jgi:L-alanine-DL-glutamate epimerase-like enolase superfamily enzyme